MKNSKGIVIYVGKANSLKKRIKQYFTPGRDERATVPFLVNELHHIDTIVVHTEKEALLLENTLIKKHKPKFNILLKDDKNYISLCINPNDMWPRLEWNRLKSKPNDGRLYFGPYTSAKAAKETFELMSHLFPLRQCSDEELKRRSRPCLLYGMKRCIAPCVGKCTKAEYTTYVEGAIDFLKGNNQKVCAALTLEMEKASDNLEFEKAAAFLKTLRQIEHITESPTLTYKESGKDSDVIALYREADQTALICLFFREGRLMGSRHFLFEKIIQTNEEILSSFLLQYYNGETVLPEEILLSESIEEESIFSILKEKYPHSKTLKIHTPQKGDKKKLVELAQKNAETAFRQHSTKVASSEKILLDLQETLSLTRYPKVIECFDTSNLSGSNLVAASAVFVDGDEDKKKSRLYHIHGITKPDDYAAIHQALMRRLIRAKEEQIFPDLLIIDGGKGQLSTALSVLKELDLIHIDLISLVKDKAKHTKGITLEKICIPNKEEPISLPFHSPLLFFLQRIRDTTHTKAISFHKRTRKKTILKSSLDSIPGIGPTKRKKLLQHFGSVPNLKLKLDELDSLPFLNSKDKEALKQGLKEIP